MTEPVVVDKRPNHIAVVTINRPAARNAIDGDVARGLEAAWQDIEADHQVRVTVLAAAACKVFCAGADLKAVAQGRLDDLYTIDSGFAGFTGGRRTKPWIAAVDGLALAGGCELALACDMIVASTAAEFGLPEVSLGLIAAAGGLYRLPRVLPPAVATELILTGGRLSAERAAHFGMVARLTAPGEALDAALALAATIAANAPLAVTESLAIANAAADQDKAWLQRASDDAQARIRLTHDFREGPAAFIEKRVPVWRGA